METKYISHTDDEGKYLIETAEFYLYGRFALQIEDPITKYIVGDYVTINNFEYIIMKVCNDPIKIVTKYILSD